MAKRQKEWAKRQRAKLLARLGGKCQHQGCRVRKWEELEFDCIKPQGDRHHRMDPSARICFYLKQTVLDNLQILCKKHHQQKTAKEI